MIQNAHTLASLVERERGVDKTFPFGAKPAAKYNSSARTYAYVLRAHPSIYILIYGGSHSNINYDTR
jgi:hypothetical protein